MSSESGQRLPMEELKRRNASQPVATQTCPSQEEWDNLLLMISALYQLTAEQSKALENLERHTEAHTALLREASSRRKPYPTPGADGGTGAGCGGDTGDTATGWEAEREAFFSARHQAAQTESARHSMDQSAIGTGGPGADWAGAVGGVVQLGHALERGQGPAPVMDATTTHPHTDKKTLRKKQQKKIAQGHAEDDHEEEQTWQQTM